MTDNQTPRDDDRSSASALARHTAIYGAGTILSAASGILLVPLFTKSLGTDIYGLMEILNQIAEIAILFIFLGTNDGFVRFFFDGTDARWQKNVTSTTLTFIMISSLSFVLLGLGVFFLFPDFGQKFGIPITLAVIYAMWLPFDTLFRLCNQFLVASQLPVLFVATNTGRFLFFVGLNILFLYVFEMGLTGVFLAALVASAVVGTGFLVYLWRWCGFHIDVRLLKDMLSFGLPYLPTAGFAYIFLNADRFALGTFDSLDSVGLYSLGAKIGTIGMVLLMKPITSVWGPFIYSAFSRPDGGKRIGDALTIYSAILVYFALGIALSGSFIIEFLADPDFFGAVEIVPLVALGGVFYGMACLSDVGVKVAKKTKYKPVIFGLTALASVALHLTITREFGLMGAAVSTTATMLIFFLINHLVSMRFYVVELHLRDFLAMFGPAFVLYFSFSGLIENVDSLLWVAVILLLAAAAFPVLFVFFSRFEFARFAGLLSSNVARSQ
ncbi:MAG: oligosaccharide flippase family protein [Woeseia sp.]|nr:oligosaccharide flippase family protein [Woeseia sp.]NNE59309.1 oligosaccharide flippase family protein [Woeseia sp.]NNL54561.1 oligosaccharide flippase family protein [Woeseia sp.]